MAFFPERQSLRQQGEKVINLLFFLPSMLTIVSLLNGIKELPSLPAENIPLWVDCMSITEEEAAQLQQRFSLHPVTVDDLALSRTTIKVEPFPEYLVAVFYVIGKGKKLVEVDFIIGKNFLITNHREKLRSAQALLEDKGKLQYLAGKGIDFLLHHLLDHEVDAFFPVLYEIDQEMERVEALIAKKHSTEVLHRIMALKKEIVAIKRIVLPQREKLALLAKDEFPFISRKTGPYFRNVYDSFVRVYESIENYRESISSVYELYMSTVSYRMNEIMKVLSVIATIALPLTVVSSIYGTNFRNLPGATAYYGFWFMLTGMLGMIGVMFVYFWRKKWV